ncbi:hypothetical protein ACHAXT_000626 [Thalassiosira profunda]
MATKVLVLSPSSAKGRSRRRSSAEGIAPESSSPGAGSPSVGHASEPSATDGRDGLHTFLHRELRISSDVADAYCSSLIDNGYDDVASLQDATEPDLKELGVKIGHIRRIKRAVFSSCLRNHSERRSSSSMRRVSERHPFSLSEGTDETMGGSGRKSIEGSLLSEYARREMSQYSTPASRERGVDADLASAKELLIRKQAEKIASLEAKLASAGINLSVDHDDPFPHLSSRGASRGGSAGSKKLTPEERLEQHRQRKLQENKYKEKTGVWEPPPPKKREKSLAKKVAENDDLVHKLTSDPAHRKRIDEEERRTKRAQRKSLGEDDSGFPRDRWSSSRRGSSRGEGSASHVASRQPQRRVSCETCGSGHDCEPDVDNPGVFYCKSCWEEYEEEVDASESPNNQLVPQTAPTPVSPIDDDPTHHALWIVHDNPQLGEKVIYTGPRRMECMLETKEPGRKNCVRIVVGDIDYSGKVRHSGMGNAPARETEVGTECIRLRNVRGYRVDHSAAASRLSRDKAIHEFHLGEESATLLTGTAASQTVEEFFRGCNGAIDVILDPQKDFGGWYPQREARSGGRKIAPQFRSKGVGYIRLGDDMSENGLAFLSSNACAAFLSSVGTSSRRASTSTSKPALPPASKQSSKRGSEKSASSAGPRSKANSFRRQPPTSQQYESEDESSDEESVEEAPKVTDVLKQLQNETNMKWKDKAELLSHLGKGASRPDGRHSRTGALNVIQDTLGTKNVNVHVLRSSLIAAGMIGVSMGGELVTQISWKTIMIETLKLLKSKQCGSVAKTVLAQLHGRCFTLANSMECISHVLGVGLAVTASKGRKSRVSLVMESPKPRRTSASSGTNIEVIEWLAETTERERALEVIEPMLDRSGLSMLINLFFSHVDHRDQRCRKNVYDGLMHCALYGVQRLELDLTRVMRMFSGLKETNPRAWNTIFQGVKVVLDEER